jgi:Ca-activated chloride channel family protein
MIPVVLSVALLASSWIQGQTIKVSAHLVLVPVSVTDASGKIVTDLRAEDFVVEENGTPASVARIGSPGETSLEMALVLDLSGSVRARFDLELLAAEKFLRRIFRPGDAVSVISVGGEPRILQTRTTSLDQALRGLALNRPAREATAFFDCVVAAAHVLRAFTRPDARRVLVVLSDGEDNKSTGYQLTDTIREVQEADCLFYSVNPSGRSIRINRVGLAGQEAMEALALHTGGAALVADRVEDLNEFYGRIAAVLQGQYLLGYYSPDPREDRSYRRITVRIPSQPQLNVRARQGYYAVKAPPGA